MLQIVLLVVVLTALTPLVGGYMARVFQGERVGLSTLLRGPERLVYRALRLDPTEGQNWREYARSVLVFSFIGWLALYLVLRSQAAHPFNPNDFGPGPWDLSFNTASSFVTNTSWQFYAGETTLSYFSQMAGITVASFTSAAVGMAVAVALIRALASRTGAALGNFWVDVTRALLYVLLPLSVLGALVLCAGGVLQSLVHGPVASQESIKLLSGDGGGFFNVNSAMPFENPSAFTNFVEVLLMLLIPAALTATFGRMVGQRRQGWAVYAAMLVLFLGGVTVLSAAEAQPTPALQAAGLQGVNLEGKEQRFGTAGSALFVNAATAGGDGAVNSALESFTGTGGLVPMANIMTGEVVFGGPGSGLYGMLLLLLVAVFIAGQMVGRTPEYLGKTIGIRETKLVVLGTLIGPLVVLASTILAVATGFGRASIFASGPQGYSESLYAYLSQANNNGSAFAGYTGFVQPNGPGNDGAFGTTFADLLGGGAMLVGRFAPILVVLALAGSLAPKRVAPAGAGTLRTDTPTFVIYLIGFTLVYAALNFLGPVLLGPGVQGLTNELF